MILALCRSWIRVDQPVEGIGLEGIKGDGDGWGTRLVTVFVHLGWVRG